MPASSARRSMRLDHQDISGEPKQRTTAPYVTSIPACATVMASPSASWLNIPAGARMQTPTKKLPINKERAERRAGVMEVSEPKLLDANAHRGWNCGDPRDGSDQIAGGWSSGVMATRQAARPACAEIQGRPLGGPSDTLESSTNLYVAFSVERLSLARTVHIPLPWSRSWICCVVR
jgi:hypothetical protein